MTIKHANYHISWIDHSSSPDLSIDNLNEGCSWRILPLASNLGSVQMKILHLGMGMTLLHWKFQFSPEARGKRIPFVELNGTPPERALTIRSITGGSIGFKDADLDYELTISPDADLYRLNSVEHYKVYLNGSANCQLINLRIGETQLNSLLGHASSQMLLQQLNLTSARNVSLNRASSVARAVLHSTFLDKYLAQTEVFHTQAVVMEYLATLITDFAADLVIELDRKLSSMMTKLHEQLSKLTDEHPSLVELGEQYQTPPRTLNHQFIKHFDESIHSFINSQRLNRAHYAITNTKQALKVIADNLSYSNVNYFSAAFKKYFGYSPSQIRKHNNNPPS